MSDYKSNLTEYNPIPSILRHLGASTREEIHEFAAKYESIDPEAAIKDALAQGLIKVKKSKQSDSLDEFNLA